MSKLLSKLTASIAVAPDEVSKAELLAKKAGYLARLGAFDEAQTTISQLRSRFGDGRSPRVLLWTMLAEGLLYTYRDMADEGADRIMRANVLAGATRDRALISATAAWRAHQQSERSDFKGMARSLNDAFANCDNDDHEILARLYLTVGNARMSTGDRAIANELYMYARHHALECGDQATIDALIYNKAAFALAWLRVRACYGDSNPELLRQLRVELASAKAYQQLANVAALSNFVFLWEARLHMLAGEYQAAIAAFESVRKLHPFAGYNYHSAITSLEIAYCQLRDGVPLVDTTTVRDSINADLADLHEDDRLVAAWLRCQVIAAIPALGDAEIHEQALEQQRREFDSSCAELREILDGLQPHPHIRRPMIAAPKMPS